MIDKDQKMRDRIASLDHVKPPTNWNPNNTWKRIHPGIPYRKRAVWLIAASIITFLIAFLIFTQKPHTPALVEGGEKEKPQQLVQSRSLVIESSDEKQDHQQPVSKPLADTSAHQEPIATPKHVAHADVSQPSNEELPPPTISPDSLEKEVLVVENIDIPKLPNVDGLPIEAPPNSQKPKINLNITIAIHSDKPPKQNVVKKSIIKVNGSQDFMADKRFYTVQLFKQDHTLKTTKMIRKTHIALICAWLGGMLSANAQVNDTVRVEFNENSRIEYIFKEPRDFAVFEQVNLDSITRELAGQVKAIPYGTDTVISLSDATVKTEERERFEALEISGTIGASLVRHKLVPHYGVRIGVSVGYKEPSIVKTDNEEVKMTIFGEYQHLMFFERAGENDYSSFGNGFANLGFMARSKDNRGMGLSLGYLVNQNGTYFGENTMKLEFHVSTKKSLSMSPFIIATDNFQSFIPGVRIGFF